MDCAGVGFGVASGIPECGVEGVAEEDLGAEGADHGGGYGVWRGGGG